MRNGRPFGREKLVIRGTRDISDEELSTYLSGEFVRGPILVAWLQGVQTQCGAGYAGVILNHFKTLRSEPFKISHRDWQRFGVDHQTGRRWLRSLTGGGYITLKAVMGQSPRIRIVAMAPPEAPGFETE